MFTLAIYFVLMKDLPLTIDLLKKADERVIAGIYNQYKSDFFVFATQFHINKETVTDVYQDAIIALIENAKKGLLDDLNCSLKTYLFSIGKFMIFRKLKVKKETVIYTEKLIESIEWDFLEEEQEQKEMKLLQQGFANLGAQCQKVLQLFYFEEKKLDEIMKLLQYTNKEVLKSQKSRCIKQLKNLINLRNG